MAGKASFFPLAPFCTLSAWLDWDYLESLGWDGPRNVESCLQIGVFPSHKGCFNLGVDDDFSGRLRPPVPMEGACWELPFLLWVAERGPQALLHVIGQAREKSVALPVNRVFAAPEGSPNASQLIRCASDEVRRGWTILEMLVGLLPYPSQRDAFYFSKKDVMTRKRVLESIHVLLDAGAFPAPELVSISAIHGPALWSAFGARGLVWKGNPYLIDVVETMGLTRASPSECLGYLVSTGMVPTGDFLLHALSGHPSRLGAASHDFSVEYFDMLVNAGMDLHEVNLSGNVWKSVAENAFWNRSHPEKRAQHLEKVLKKVQWLESMGFQGSINNLVEGGPVRRWESLSPLSVLCRPVWGGSIDSMGLHPEIIAKFLELGANPGLRGVNNEGGEGKLPVELVEGDEEDSMTARLVLMAAMDMEKLSGLPAAPSSSTLRRL